MHLYTSTPAFIGTGEYMVSRRTKKNLLGTSHNLEICSYKYKSDKETKIINCKSQCHAAVKRNIAKPAVKMLYVILNTEPG